MHERREVRQRLIQPPHVTVLRAFLVLELLLAEQDRLGRSYLALMKYAEVIEKVLPNKPARPDAPRRTIFFQDFEHPTTGKWTTRAMKVTGGGPLKAGHKVDDIFFFAGPPGSKTTRLMVDNVRLEGNDE